jgi:RNA polymerase sigma factor (sigma-70 family)
MTDVKLNREAIGVSSRGGIFGFLSRLDRLPTVDSDADLLERFIKTADEAAFRGIVQRHGMMVLAICKRRLRRETDAEDAFQAVFLALVKAARSIARRESLPGWLYRVAYLVSLKAAGLRARHKLVAWPAEEVPMPGPSNQPWESDELKTIVDAELAGLPDKLRTVIVLCLIEGRTNTEAAAILGIPVGTIDSRLSTARKRLGARLLRRGVAVGVGGSLSQMLGGPLAAADGPGLQSLISHTVPAILAEAAGPGTVSSTVVSLAQGVTLMTTSRLRLVAAVGIAIGLLGGTATGIYFATANADPPKPVANQEVKSQDIVAPATEKSISAVATAEPGSDSAPLLKPLKNLKLGAMGSMKMQNLFALVEDETDLVVRVDVGAFRRLGYMQGNYEAGGEDSKVFLSDLYEKQVVLPRKADKLPMRDVLADALAQFGKQEVGYTYQVRGNQLVIVPAFQVPGKPGVDQLNPVAQVARPGEEDEAPLLPAQQIYQQIYGGVVNVSAKQKPLADILADLRLQTGANIVYDPRCDAVLKAADNKLTIALNDARLYDALRVIADLAGLKMVYAGNIYYVTTLENAKAFQPPSPPHQRMPFWQMGGLGPTPPATNPSPTPANESKK